MEIPILRTKGVALLSYLRKFSKLSRQAYFKIAPSDIL